MSAADKSKINSLMLSPLSLFTGRNGVGACTLAGAQVGDRVILVLEMGAIVDNFMASFETEITVAGQIRQLSSSNWASVTFMIITSRGLAAP